MIREVEGLARKKVDSFAVFMLLLIVLASSLIFYSENYQEKSYQPSAGEVSTGAAGQVSVYILPKEDNSNIKQVNGNG